MKVSTKIDELLRPAVEALGYDLWGCEYISQGRHSLLRVYIDSVSGIMVDDCEKASRQISAILDVEDPIKGAYSLEVSSPGLERPLYVLEHFQRYLGSKVKIRMRTPIEGQRSFNGVLQSADENFVRILVEQRELLLSTAEIEKANLLMG